MINIKSSHEIDAMRAGGKKLSLIMTLLAKKIKHGISTISLNNLAYKLIISCGGEPSFLHFKGYPYSICISINDEVVHGLPSQRQIKKGDLISLDIGLKYRDFHTDMAVTIPIMPVKPEFLRLIATTKRSLSVAIKTIKPGIHLGDIQAVIQNINQKAGYSIVRGLTGHGIGRELQEEPSIPNYGKSNTGIILQPGMVLAIEPMINLGSSKVNILADGWTIVTADGLPSAHFEHTIAVTKNGYEILTK